MTDPLSPAPVRPALAFLLNNMSRPVTPPSWWRHGAIPLIALICSGFAMDFIMGTMQGWGIGTALGILLYTAAFLLLRKDISSKVRWLLIITALLNATATGMNLSPDACFNLLIAILLPFVVMTSSLSREKGNPYDPSEKYKSWWKYKFFRLQQAQKTATGIGGKLPLVGSVIIGVILFLIFLSIFADGNPVVAAFRETMNEWIGRYCSWLMPDATIFVHILLWFMGAFLFGLVTRHRPLDSFAEDRPIQPGKPWLPSLPTISLLFINLAFLINNGTDIAFLWLGTVPDGISQTAYLHDGADSIMLAAVLSAFMLLLLFRPSGSVRASKTGRILGFALAAQTGLLASSVALRLYYQIEDFGFSPNRITAGVYLLLGTGCLLFLFRYMARNGNWLRYGAHCGALALVFLGLTGFRSTSQLSGDLNMMCMDSHPGWYFSDGDLLRFNLPGNIPFALAVYQRLGGDTVAGANVHAMIRETLFHSRERTNWRSFNLQEWQRKRQQRMFLELPAPTVTPTYGTNAWSPSSRPTSMQPR